MKARSILLLTNGHLCRNPRVVKEATTLGEAGHDVTVLGVSNHPASVAVDAVLATSAPFRFLAVDLLPGAGPAAFGRRLALKFWRDLAPRLGRPTIHALGPARALLARARSLPAVLTIAHNEIAHWAGLRLLAEGRRVAADVEDWHSEDLLPQDRAGRPLALLRHIEQRLLRTCHYTTTTSRALASALQEAHGGTRPHVITNSFPLQPAPRIARPSGDGPPSLFWFSQTLGPGRGLEPLVAAWARAARPSRLVLLGEDRSGFAGTLRAAVPSGRQHLLEFLPLVPPEALPELIARHDIGLALEDSSIRSRDLTITNKILQYLNAGLAVVATPTAGQREVLARDSAAGIIIPPADPATAARVLDDLLVDRSALADRQAAARRLAENVYCWEREAPRLLALVATALHPSNPTSPALPPSA